MYIHDVRYIFFFFKYPQAAKICIVLKVFLPLSSLTVSTKQKPLYLQRTGAELLLGSIAYKLGQILGLISSWSRLPSLEFAGSANSGSCLCVQMAGKAEHGERRELLNGGKSALHLSMARK